MILPVILDIDDMTWFSADHHLGHRSVLKIAGEKGSTGTSRKRAENRTYTLNKFCESSPLSSGTILFNSSNYCPSVQIRFFSKSIPLVSILNIFINSNRKTYVLLGNSGRD